MEIELVVVRHGETDGNRYGIVQGQVDIPHNELGKKQAEAAGCVLKNDTFHLAYSSPYSRAFDTASAIIKANVNDNKVTVEKRQDLSERSFGVADGKPHAFYQELSDKAGEKMWIHVPEGGESAQDVIQRAKGFVDDLFSDLYQKWDLSQETNEKRTILIGSHGGFILGLLCHLVQDRQLTFTGPDNKYRRIPRNTAITRLTFKVAPKSSKKTKSGIVSVSCSDLYDDQHLAGLPESLHLGPIPEREHHKEAAV